MPAPRLPRLPKDLDEIIGFYRAYQVQGEAAFQDFMRRLMETVEECQRLIVAVGSVEEIERLRAEAEADRTAARDEAARLRDEAKAEAAEMREDLQAERDEFREEQAEAARQRAAERTALIQGQDALKAAQGALRAGQEKLSIDRAAADARSRLLDTREAELEARLRQLAAVGAAINFKEGN